MGCRESQARQVSSLPTVFFVPPHVKHPAVMQMISSIKTFCLPLPLFFFIYKFDLSSRAFPSSYLSSNLKAILELSAEIGGSNLNIFVSDHRLKGMAGEIILGDLDPSYCRE